MSTLVSCAFHRMKGFESTALDARTLDYRSHPQRLLFARSGRTRIATLVVGLNTAKKNLTFVLCQSYLPVVIEHK